VHVILANFGDEPFPVARGARIALLVLSPTVQASIEEVEDLETPDDSEGASPSASTNR
jgi:dUTP pyrophosphatase